MMMNHLKLAARNLLRQKQFALINIAGLAIALAACMIIVGYVTYELSFESMHLKRDRIYRVAMDLTMGETTVANAAVTHPVGPAIERAVPEVEGAARMCPFEQVEAASGESRWREAMVFFADPGAARVFSFPLVRGDSAKALGTPFSVIIDEDVSRAVFGGSDPIGRTIRLMKTHDFAVAGVMKRIPSNTQFRCRMIASFSSLERMKPEDFPAGDTSWGIGMTYTYLLLSDGADPAAVGRKIAALAEQNRPSGHASTMNFFLQPLGSIYLHPDLSNELVPRGDLRQIYLFAVVALLILAIAAINFVNLSTARTAHRLKEVGIRKTVGARRPELIAQFLCESTLLAAVAMVIGLVLGRLAMPALGAFLGRDLSLGILDHPTIALSALVMTLAVGVLAGSYPAVVLSRLPAVTVLRAGPATPASRATLRKVLVLVQFTTAIALLACTFVVLHQIRYARTKDLGFDHSNVLVLNLGDDAAKLSVLKNEILNTGIAESATALWALPNGQNRALSSIRPEGRPEGSDTLVQVMAVDPDFPATFRIPLVDGRGFRVSGDESSLIINETAVKEFGLRNPIGKRFFGRDKVYEVVGVVRDFHTNSVHSPVSPILIGMWPGMRSTLAVRVRPGSAQQSIAAIGKVWKRVLPDRLFECRLASDVINTAYEEEERLGALLGIFSGLVVFVACLGIFGLASYSTEQRTKEIGVRKVLGASIGSVLLLFAREFTTWVLVANAIAWPVASYMMHRWLQNFAYRTSVGITPFLLSGLAALLLALLTASYQSLKTALANPVDSLRYE